MPFSAPAVYKIRCPKDPDFYTPLALKMAKGQHLPALEVYKNQSPINLGDGTDQSGRLRLQGVWLDQTTRLIVKGTQVS